MAGLNIGLTALAAVHRRPRGLLALWWRTRMGGEIALMAATATSEGRHDVAKLAPGTLVRDQGNAALRAATDRRNSHSQACVYFRAEIECEEVCTTRDSDGKQRRNTRKITMHSNIQHVPCDDRRMTAAASRSISMAPRSRPLQVVIRMRLPAANAGVSRARRRVNR